MSRKGRLLSGISARSIGLAPRATSRLPVWLSHDGGKTMQRVDGHGAVLSGLEFLEPAPTLPDRQRGAVLAPKLSGYMRPGEPSRLEEHHGVSPDVLRLALLFNDRAEVPYISTGAVAIGSLNLEIEGVVHQHRVRPMEGGCDASTISYQIWQRLEREEPGRWTIWHSSDVQAIPPNETAPDLALRLGLQRALVVPHREASIEDVLHFKEARAPELRALRIYLEEIALRIVKSGGDIREANLEIEKFQLALDDYLRVATSSNWRKTLMGFDVKFSVGDALKSAWEAWPSTLAAGSIVSLKSAALAGLVVGGKLVQGGLTVEKAIGPKGAKGPPHPFQYIAHIARDL